MYIIAIIFSINDYFNVNWYYDAYKYSKAYIYMCMFTTAEAIQFFTKFKLQLRLYGTWKNFFPIGAAG